MCGQSCLLAAQSVHSMMEGAVAAVDSNQSARQACSSQQQPLTNSRSCLGPAAAQRLHADAPQKHGSGQVNKCQDSAPHRKSQLGSAAWLAPSMKGTKPKQSLRSSKARLRTQAKPHCSQLGPPARVGEVGGAGWAGQGWVGRAS